MPDSLKMTAISANICPMADQPTHVTKALQEEVAIQPYDPAWPHLFEEEKQQLLATLPKELIGRIEHFGSTAVPGLASKPIIDMLVEVASLEAVHRTIAPILERLNYDYFWRPKYLGSDDIGYAWFIKRDPQGKRTHHIHMLEKSSGDWERLLFRDYLIDHPDVAKQYEALKYELVEKHAQDRRAYAQAKTDFINRITQTAKKYYESKQ